MPRLPPDARARRAVAYARKRNRLEATDVTPASVERRLREQYVKENPAATVAEVEERIARALERGMRRSPPPPPPAPPAPPTAARMAARAAAKLARKRARKRS